MGRIGILFVLGKFDQGGAERQLLNLLKGLNKEKFMPIVATYYEGGRWEGRVKTISGVKYHCLNIKGRFDLPGLFMGILKLIRYYRPSIVFGLMGDACTASLPVKFLGGCKVIWGLRATKMDFDCYSRASKWTYKLNARLSGLVDVIVSNSWSGRSYHALNGYRKSKIVVIPNGIDTNLFSYSSQGAMALRRSYDLPEEALLIGRVGRIDPMKDYPTFLKAAALLSTRYQDALFLIAGDGDKDLKDKLKKFASSLGIEKRIFWLGQTEKISAFYSACEITCSSSSFGEGFPNAVAESMACERLCAATDVGDTRKILGAVGGIAVSPKNPEALSKAANELLSMPKDERVKMEQAARQRIVERFGLERMVSAYEELFLGLCEQEKPEGLKAI